MRDLFFLVADTNMEFAIRGFFERGAPHQILGCRPIEFDPARDRDILVASGDADPGLYVRANEWLKARAGGYRHVVVMIDEEWEGSPGAEAIRQRLQEHIENAGWAASDGLGLVLEPEVDVWLWSDSPHTATTMGWASWQELRAELEAAKWLAPETSKPVRPKEAADWALRRKKIPRSSDIYRQITSRVSVSRCQDPALQILLDTLRSWFPFPLEEM